MFDIGFPELMIVAVVMLLVLGPERLPETLRMLGLWLGRLRRSFNAVKTEIEKEVGMDEIKRQLHNEAIMEEMKRLEAQVRNPLQPDSNAGNNATAGISADSTHTATNTTAETGDTAAATEQPDLPPATAEPTMHNNPAKAAPAADSASSSQAANNP